MCTKPFIELIITIGLIEPLNNFSKPVGLHNQLIKNIMVYDVALTGHKLIQ